MEWGGWVVGVGVGEEWVVVWVGVYGFEGVFEGVVEEVLEVVVYLFCECWVEGEVGEFGLVDYLVEGEVGEVVFDVVVVDVVMDVGELDLVDVVGVVGIVEDVVFVICLECGCEVGVYFIYCDGVVGFEDVGVEGGVVEGLVFGFIEEID